MNHGVFKRSKGGPTSVRICVALTNEFVVKLFSMSEELGRNGETEDELERLSEHHCGPY